jgi:hypothetical protein
MKEHAGFKEMEFDFYIKVVGQEKEVSFLESVEIDCAIDRSIEIARELKSDIILLFKGRKFIINSKTEPVDVMKKYVFG